MPKTKPLYCRTCGQVITEQHALEQERKRLDEKLKQEALDKALETAAEVVLAKIKKLLTKINQDAKGKLRLYVDEWWEGEDLKNPIGINFGIEVGGLTTGEPLDTIDDMKSIKAFFKKFGYGLK